MWNAYRVDTGGNIHRVEYFVHTYIYLSRGPSVISVERLRARNIALEWLAASISDVHLAMTTTKFNIMKCCYVILRK